MQILLFTLGLVLFMGLILIHEWGHLLAARRNGVEVEEFGLGFPPRIATKKLKSGLLLSLNVLPLGGFVKLKGENDADERPGSFGAANLRAKTKIMLAGVGMNLLAGVVLLTILALIGMPKILDVRSVGEEQFTVAGDTKITHQQVRAGAILPNSPAAKAGLKKTDILLKISNDKQSSSLLTARDVQVATAGFAGEQVKLTYERDGQTRTAQTKLLGKTEVQASRNTDNPKGYLGIVPTELQIRRSTWSAPIVALGFTKQLIVLTLEGLGKALAGLGSTIAGIVTGNSTARTEGQAKATAQVGGPVAIGAVLWSGGSLGINFMLMIIAVISLTLALINVLPIPALDGGRLLVTSASRLILKRPLSQKAEERIHGTGMLVLLGLIVLITIVDVKRFL